MTYFEQAKAKLAEEIKSGKFDRYGSAMKGAVEAALLDFAGQDEEFAQAIVQGGKFEDCMKEVAKGITGQSISDLEAYRRAVSFYFPGADIHMAMTIDLCASVKSGVSPSVSASADSSRIRGSQPAGLVLDLSAFF